MEYAVMRMGKLKKKSQMLRVMQEKFYILTIQGQLLVHSSTGFKTVTTAPPLLFADAAVMTRDEPWVPYHAMKLVTQLTANTAVDSMDYNGSCKLLINVGGRASLELEAPSAEEGHAWARALEETVQIMQAVAFAGYLQLQPLHGVNTSGHGWYMTPNGRMGLFEKMTSSNVWTVQGMHEYDEMLLLDHASRTQNQVQTLRSPAAAGKAGAPLAPSPTATSATASTPTQSNAAATPLSASARSAARRSPAAAAAAAQIDVLAEDEGGEEEGDMRSLVSPRPPGVGGAAPFQAATLQQQRQQPSPEPQPRRQEGRKALGGVELLIAGY
eukprot:TRINITY_DN13431_c0_g1_i1.p1 TRINITY_DN13431_c0_g1~~TRINITY_DN13431_c0_g1_i1.p1  ORF type:complete len:327 (+),score=86.38 TRINITY_DN13431_c0_g1_i1:172-1152(+)